MAISQDIERGCTGVPGQPYNLLLNRSVDFDTRTLASCSRALATRVTCR